MTAAASERADNAGPRSRKGAETRARLVDAARDVFAEHGFFDARISDIAERAGLSSHAAFYHYFESKEDIFREVAEAVDMQVSVAIAAMYAPASTGTPYEHLHAAIRSYFELYRANARIMEIIEQVSRYDTNIGEARMARRKSYVAEIAKSIRELQRRRLADRTIDPDVAAMALGQMTASFAELWLAQGALRVGMDRAVDQISAMYANALGIERTEATDRAPRRGR